MKDYLHMFGGVLAAIVLLAAYAFAWNAVAKCYGAEVSGLKEVNRLAPDGANTETLFVDEGGNVVGSKSTALYVPTPYIEDNRTPPSVKSGDKVLIGDFEFVLISDADWSRLTNTIDKVERIVERRHTAELRTDEGRQRWHGELIDRTATPDGRAVVYTYADGFTYTEKARAEIKQSPAVQKVRRTAPKPRPVKVEYDAPARLRAKQEAANARPAVKEVNAVFTAGGKVKVEGE